MKHHPHKRSDGKIQVSTTMDPALVKKIQALADKNHHSRNKAINLIIDDWLRNRGHGRP